MQSCIGVYLMVCTVSAYLLCFQQMPNSSYLEERLIFNGENSWFYLMSSFPCDSLVMINAFWLLSLL
jgi:hypothetical protein